MNGNTARFSGKNLDHSKIMQNMPSFSNDKNSQKILIKKLTFISKTVFIFYKALLRTIIPENMSLKALVDHSKRMQKMPFLTVFNFL